MKEFYSIFVYNKVDRTYIYISWREAKKVLANAKKIPKEKGLQAVICCCIWEPDEAIEKARRKEIYDSDIRGVADSEDYKLLYGI